MALLPLLKGLRTMGRRTYRNEDEHEAYVLGDGKAIRETDKALLVKCTGDAAELADNEEGTIWIPKSQIHEDSEVWKVKQEEGSVVVNRWWASKQGWCDGD